MAGYEDTRQKIISTLMGRPVGTEIQPENHQDYALNMLDYIRSLELIATSTLIGVAESNTTPVQPNSSRVCYIAGVAQNQTVVFENFIGENGTPISVTTGDMEGVFIILMWNTQYWSAQTFSTNIISNSESATFYYRYNIRKTYASTALMNADVTSPIGTDGKYIKVGDIVTVVNSTTPSENGIYSYEGATDGWKYQSSFNFQLSQTTGDDPNVAMSQKIVTEQVHEINIKTFSDFEIESGSYSDSDAKTKISRIDRVRFDRIIPIECVNKIKISSPYKMWIFILDENKVMIGDGRYSNDWVSNVTQEQILAVSPNVRYINVSIRNELNTSEDLSNLIHEIKNNIISNTTWNDISTILSNLTKKSSSIDEQVHEINSKEYEIIPKWEKVGYILPSSPPVITPDNNWMVSSPIFIKKGNTIKIGTQGSGAVFIAETDENSSYYTSLISASGVTGYNYYSYTATEDMYIALSGKIIFGDVKVTNKYTKTYALLTDLPSLDTYNDYYISGNNSSFLNSFIVTDTKITIKSDGFSVIRKRDNKLIGYVGYVSGEDESNTFDLTSSGLRTLYVIDVSTLVVGSRTSFSRAIKKYIDVVDGSLSSYPYIALVSFYVSNIVPYGLLSSLVSSYLLSQQNQRQLSFNLRYNVNVDGMRIDGMKIYIKPSGFGVFYNNKIYYIADATNTRVNDYEFDLTPIGVTYVYLVLDETKLILENVRNELSSVIKIVQGDLIKSTSIILAVSDAQTGKVRFVGQFADYFAKYATKEYVDSLGINNSNFRLKIFEPEFYAYKIGRINDVNGVGTGWYERFRMIHISDTHQYNTLVLEAIKMAQSKVHVIANTGDDGNGSVSTPTETSISWMQNVVSIVTANNILPYLAVKGNHDICNITRSQYRNNIGLLIQQHANVIWGNSDGAYGYYDITPNVTMGTFRIILLDPFDYPDGDFPNTRAFMTATFSQNQIDWLISTLLEAATNNYHVITMMHYSFGDNSLNFNDEKAKPDALFYQDAFMIPDIIDSIQNKTLLNKTYIDSVGTQNIIINQDFSTVGNLDYVCHLFGHIHSKNEYWCQKTDGSKMYDILMLGESAIGTYGNALNKVYRDPGTVNEIEFSALEIDTIEKAIYRVSYGAFLKYDKTNMPSDRTKKLNYRKS